VASTERLPDVKGKPRWRGIYRDGAGKKKSKTFARRGGALAWAQDKERATRRSGPALDPVDVLKFSQWSETWLRDIANRTRLSTYTEHKRLVQARLDPRFGEMKLDRITTDALGEWVEEMLLPDFARARPALRKESVRDYYAVMARSLRDAVEAGHLDAVPRRPRQLPGPTASRSDMRALNDDEVKALILATPAGQDRALIELLIYGGLRIGEALALRVRDLDGTSLDVRRTVGFINGKPEVGTPKTEAGIRVVKIPTQLSETLAAMVGGRRRDDLVFCSATGGFINRRNWSKRVFKKAAVEAGLIPVRAHGAARATGTDRLRVHDLRHTAITLWIGAGWPVNAISRRAGHANISTTLNVYGHMLDDEDQDDIDALMA
jgi:integrase